MRKLIKSLMSRDAAKLYLLVFVLILVRVLFFSIKPNSAVSHDIYYWHEVVRLLDQGINPYSSSTRLNWPPLWMQLLFLFSSLSKATGVALIYWIVGSLIVIESLLVSILYFWGKVSPWVILWGVCLNPIPIFLICQHGNFDVIVGLFILLFVLFARSFNETGAQSDWLLSCFMLGLAILSKTAPIVLIPLLAYRAEKRVDIKTFFIGIILLLGPTVLGMSIIFSLAPESVLRNVIQYRSIAQSFGIPGIFKAFGKEEMIKHYGSLFFLLILSTAVYISRLCRLRQDLRYEQFLILGMCTLMMIPALGPGYGNQYIYWFIPLMVLIYQNVDEGFRRTLGYFFLIALITYTIDYGFLENHGELFCHLSATSGCKWRDAVFGDPLKLFSIHLPLFVCYLAVIFDGFLRLAPGTRFSPLNSRIAG